MIDLELQSKWELDPSDFKKNPNKDNIKSGYMTSEYYTQKSTSRRCIIKKTNRSLRNEETNKFYHQTLSIFSTIRHPAIVPFVGFYTKKNVGFIVEEEVENGSLRDAVAKVSSKETADPLWDETHKLIIAYGLSCALEFLHDKRVVHRDVKPGCVLLDTELHPHLAGFTCAKRVDPHQLHSDDLRQTTPIIMAPEFLEDPETYSTSLPVDVYAFGVTIYSLVAETEPYANKTIYSFLNSILRGKRPAFPPGVRSKWRDLISKCWSQVPDERPSFTMICDFLESDEFLDDTIDRDVFDDYKKIVKPFRPIKNDLTET